MASWNQILSAQKQGQSLEFLKEEIHNKSSIYLAFVTSKMYLSPN